MKGVLLFAAFLTLFYHVKCCSPFWASDAPEPKATEKPVPEVAITPPRWKTTNDSSLRFFVLGDFGGQHEFPFTTHEQLLTARTMRTVADTFHPDFMITLGDNFYDVGVENVEDQRFRLTFESVYEADSLQVPWYISSGNHDWEGNMTAQILYSSVSSRWRFPYYYYTDRIRINPATRSTVLLVVIDTVILCGNINHHALGSPAAGPDDGAWEDQHLRWIEEQLEQSNDTYVLVAGHYPVWSIGSHGPTDCLVSKLHPLLEKYKVTAYLSGHDHNLQHIRKTNSTVNYIVSGAAHNIDPSTYFRTSVPSQWHVFQFGDYRKKGGFAYVTATDDAMMLTFVDSTDVRDLHEVVMKPRNV